MKANQVYNFSTGFKFPQNFLLMNYKLNKTHNHTWKSNADLSRINSWGHKLYINTLLYDYTFLSNNLTRRRGMKIGIVGVRRRPGQNRVTWKTPSRAAFVPLQEPVAVLASNVPHTQTPV
jgi:hypothetical protein